MSKNRWGGSSGPTTRPSGKARRAIRTARDWADDKTGRNASSAWKAASKEKGFRARSKAASRAVRKKGGGRIVSGAVGVITAAFAGLASLFGKSKKKTATRGKHSADTPADRYARDGYKLGDPVPGAPGSYYADPRDTRPGYVDPRGGGAYPGYTTTNYDSNIDPRTWEQRVAAGDVPGFSPKTSSTTASTSTPTGGTTMAGLPAAQIAHDMASAMSRYEPADAWAVVAESKQWPDVSAQVAMSVKAYADRLEGARFPLNPAIVGKLQEYFQALAASRALAEEIEPLLQRAHAEDIAKRENPRGDESKWNV